MNQEDFEGHLDFENITPTEGLKDYIRSVVIGRWRTLARNRSLAPKSYEIWFSRQLLQSQVVCEMRVYGENGELWEGVGVDKNAKQALERCLAELIYYQYHAEGTTAYHQQYSAIHA